MNRVWERLPGVAGAGAAHLARRRHRRESCREPMWADGERVARSEGLCPWFREKGREKGGGGTARPAGHSLGVLPSCTTPVTCRYRARHTATASHQGRFGPSEDLCVASVLTPQGLLEGGTPSSGPSLPASPTYPECHCGAGMEGGFRWSSVLATTGCGRCPHSPSPGPKAALPASLPSTPCPALSP